MTVSNDSAAFEPLFTQDGGDFGGAAYAVYDFEMTGYNRESTVFYGTDDPAAAAQSMWLGLSNWEHNAWQWQRFDASGQSSSDFGPCVKDDHMLVAVVVLGSDNRRLDSLRLGSRDSWTHSYGGAGLDNSDCVVSAPDDSVYVCGYSTSFSAYQGCLILKYSRLGELLWARVISMPDAALRSELGVADYGFCVTGSLGLAGMCCIDTTPEDSDLTSEDALLFRLDPDGNLIWQHRWAIEGQAIFPRVAGFSDGSVSAFIEDNAEHYASNTQTDWETVHLHIGPNNEVVQDSRLLAKEPAERVNTVDARLFNTTTADVYSLFIDGSIGGTAGYGGMRINMDGSFGSFPLEQPGAPLGGDYIQTRNHFQTGLNSAILCERIASPTGAQQTRDWGKIFIVSGTERSSDGIFSSPGGLVICSGSCRGDSQMTPVLVAFDNETGDYVSSWEYGAQGATARLATDSYGDIYTPIFASGNFWGPLPVVSGTIGAWTRQAPASVNVVEGALVFLGNGSEQHASQSDYAGAVTDGTAEISTPTGAVIDADGGNGDFVICKRDVTSFW